MRVRPNETSHNLICSNASSKPRTGGSRTFVLDADSILPVEQRCHMVAHLHVLKWTAGYRFSVDIRHDETSCEFVPACRY